MGLKVNWKGVGFGNLGFCIIMRLIYFGQRRHASQTFSFRLKDIIGIEAQIWPLPKFDFRIVHLQIIFKTKKFNFQALIHFESKCICTSKYQFLCRIGDLFYSYLICFTFCKPKVLVGSLWRWILQYHLLEPLDSRHQAHVNQKHGKNCECCPGHSLTVSQPFKSLSL